MKKGASNATERVVLIAMLSAALTAGKLALAVVPNVEIVTLLIIVFTSVYGLKISLPVTFIFVATETLIFGFNTWVISYFIYWPSLALISGLGHFVVNKRLKHLFFVAVAVIMTALFGVITSLVDAILLIDLTSASFFKLFSIIYLRGTTFYIVHAASNALVIGRLVMPLRIIFGSMSLGRISIKRQKSKSAVFDFCENKY